MNKIFNVIPHQLLAYLIAFAMSLALARIMIPLLKRLKCGQTVREEGPESHKAKSGTPTMGGLLFLIPMVLVGGWYAIKDHRILVLILVTLGFGLIGFLDDYLKVVRKHNTGLKPKQKMLGLLIVSGAFTWYAISYIPSASTLVIPFIGLKAPVTLPVAIAVPFSIFVLAAFTNAVNLTDGLDGLAGTVTTLVLLFLTIMSTFRDDWEYIRTFCAILAGGLLGFLVFNLHPAKVFMGDVGALALGGALAAMALMTGTAIYLGIAGIIYVAEALSVVIQVFWFKRTRRRVFLMSPLHHHYEYKGWKETKVVTVFALVTLAAGVVAVLLL
ncbi:MAG TPA: phospho-N-acetylmuramoyl-pentapeptide-transferase [Thermoclostridium caenicola]|uniref:phospho-N-acetylmuramoyl-pentapeptide- transferase n=1 Tax=Thermoclostridium caenicola TaxID=659425 RepID=UPI002CEE0412|nr:phospho-N-acetylmuramoyl-pentapeptide-transferase [Thermoclostridium caenicola]HPO76571.1 phospho-N-acetylmuramoyl-pentapeptide-transferase [Thermoclostridium caenicola]